MPTIPPKQERKQFELVKAGTHVAILYSIIHLGTQKTTFQGKEKTAYKIRLSFELPNLKKVFKEGEEAKPMSIGSKLSLSMFSKAKLRPLVEGIIGVSLPDDVADSYDIENLLGKPCLISVKHEIGSDGKIYATIAATSQLMDGMATPVQTNPSRVINLFAEWDEAVYQSLPEYLRKEIDSSLERSKPVKQGNAIKQEVDEFDSGMIEYPTDAPNPEDIPF